MMNNNHLAKFFPGYDDEELPDLNFSMGFCQQYIQMRQ